MESTPQTKLYYHIELYIEDDFTDYSSWVSKWDTSVHSKLHILEIPQEKITQFLKKWVVEINTHNDDDFIIAVTNFEALQHRVAWTVNEVDQWGIKKDFSDLDRNLKSSFNDFCYELFEGEIKRLTTEPQQAPS